MQVWVARGPNAVYVAHTNGDRWFLLHRGWPETRKAFLVKKDGSIWAYRDRGYDDRTKSTLDDLEPTGETGTRCAACDRVSVRGEDRHSRECSLRP